MSTKTSDICPQPEVLVQFLQGKLHPPQLDRCEDHLKNCALCHDTLYGINIDDTLTERLAEVFSHQKTEEASEDQETSEKIGNLLDRITSQEFKRTAMASGSVGEVARTPEMEIIADRAAEVLRCVSQQDGSLGVLGDYTLVRLIGAGSTGVVFEAVDRTLDRTVALKILRPSLGEIARNRFVVEAKLAASIEHANVVTIFQVGQVDRLAFMAMPWIPGQTLEAMLASGEQLSKGEIVEIVRQVAAGLDAAHKKQLVHRDIKPANLWICQEDKTLKILDFGLARINDENPSMTATGMLAGTPGFMSPEQTRGLELDGRSDLFSLGCVMYRLLSGRAPFGAPTVLATLSSIQSDHPAAPAVINKDVDRDLSDIAMCLLEKQPFNRPQSAEQTIELLTTPRKQWPVSVAVNKTVGVSFERENRTRVAAASRRGSGRGAGRWGTWALIGSLLLGGFGWMFAPQIIRVATDQGEVVIQTTDDNVEIQVLQDGEEIDVIDTKTQQSFSLKSGQYSFNAVATDDNGDGKETNTFSIEPKTLTMRRGGSAIVSVTLVPKESAIAPSSNGETRTEASAKALYKGKPFQQWTETAAFDKDIPTITQAIHACAKIYDTPEELDQLLALTRKLVRKHGTNVFGRDHDSDLYNKAFMAVLENCSDDQVLRFMRQELIEGTTQSRKFLHGWMYHIGTDVISNAQQEKRSRIRMRCAELSEAFGSNLHAPYVLRLAKAMLPNTEDSEKVNEQLRTSRLGTEIRKSVQSGSLEQRYEMAELALRILPDDSGIFAIYHKDLFDANLDDATIKKDEFLWGMSQNPRLPWPVARVKLLNSFLQALAPTHWNGIRPKLDPETEARRFSTAANLLAEVVDGILPGGKQGLLLQQASQATGLAGGGLGPGMFGGGGFTSPDSFEPLPPHRFCRNVLQSIHSIGQRSSDDKVKQSLIKTLTRLEAAMGPDASIFEPVIFGSSAPLREDIAYVMANLKGTPMAALPLNSRLRNDPQTNTALKKTAPVAIAVESDIKPDTQLLPTPKPLYKGKTFAQWIEVAKFDRDRQTITAAIRACAAISETPEEQEQLLVLISSLARKHGNNTFYGQSPNGFPAASDYHDAFSSVLNASDDDRVIEFIRTEITEGTVKSRRFCASWLQGVITSMHSQISDDRLLQQKRIFQRIAELADSIAKHLSEPGVVEVATAFIPEMDEFSPVAILAKNIHQRGQLRHHFIKTTRNSALSTEVKKFVRKANLDTRYEISNLALQIFANEPEILEVYSTDLFNKELDKVTVVRFGRGQEEWPLVRVRLLKAMLHRLAPNYYTKAYAISIRPDSETEQSHLASAAKLLEKFADGLMAEEDQRLVFKRRTHGKRGMFVRPISLDSSVNEFLQYFHNIGQRCKDEKVKLSLHKKMGQLLDAIENQTSAETAPNNIPAHIEYVIARLAGGPTLPIPNGSGLRNDPSDLNAPATNEDGSNATTDNGKLIEPKSEKASGSAKESVDRE